MIIDKITTLADIYNSLHHILIILCLYSCVFMQVYPTIMLSACL